MEVQVPIFENIPKKVVSTVALFLKVLILAFFANICLNFTAPNSNSILVVIVFCTNKMKNKKFYIFKIAKLLIFWVKFVCAKVHFGHCIHNLFLKKNWFWLTWILESEKIGTKQFPD